MKLVICGSRNLKEDFDLDYLWQIVNNRFQNVTEIVSGGARGADKVGELLAKKFGLKLTIMSAKWKIFGKKAGPIRNAKMLEYADACLALYDGSSKGTKNSIKYSIENNKKVEVVILGKEYFNVKIRKKEISKDIDSLL